MQYTTNYNLRKPENTDSATVGADIGANADITDTQLKALQDQRNADLTTINNTIQSGYYSNITKRDITGAVIFELNNEIITSKTYNGGDATLSPSGSGGLTFKYIDSDVFQFTPIHKQRFFTLTVTGDVRTMTTESGRYGSMGFRSQMLLINADTNDVIGLVEGYNTSTYINSSTNGNMYGGFDVPLLFTMQNSIISPTQQFNFKVRFGITSDNSHYSGISVPSVFIGSLSKIVVQLGAKEPLMN